MKIGTCVLSVAVVWLFLSVGTDKAGITEGYHLRGAAGRCPRDHGDEWLKEDGDEKE